MSAWDVSRVTDMESAFNEAKGLTADLSKWDVSKVHKVKFMFLNANDFSQCLCSSAWVAPYASPSSLGRWQCKYYGQHNTL